jgi:homoserine dehydrogenase
LSCRGTPLKRVFAVGVGLVGKQVVHQLLLPHLSPLLRIDVLSNSKYQLLVSPDARREASALIDALPASSGPAPATSGGGGAGSGFRVQQLSLTDFIQSEIASAKQNPSVKKLFIDSTSDNAVAGSYPALLAAGISVVTPNKKAFSSSKALYDEIQSSSSSPSNPKGGLVYKESTVGAGLPIIGTLDDMVKTGDRVVKVEGVLSGTLSYIFNEFSKPVKGQTAPKFSEIVKGAKEAGYTVRFFLSRPGSVCQCRAYSRGGRRNPTRPTTCPDPTSPANSPSSADRSVPPLSLRFPRDTCQSLPRPSSPLLCKTSARATNSYPACPSLTPSSRPSARVPKTRDRFFATSASSTSRPALSNAASKGSFRHSTRHNTPRSWFSFADAMILYNSYPFSHPFASSLSGSDNIIAFQTERYSARPLLVQGSGAGAEVTAAGVVADAIRVAERLVH